MSRVGERTDLKAPTIHMNMDEHPITVKEGEHWGFQENSMEHALTPDKMNYEYQWKYIAMYGMRYKGQVFHNAIVQATMECVKDIEKGGYTAQEKNCIRSKFNKRMDAFNDIEKMYKVLRATEQIDKVYDNQI